MIRIIMKNIINELIYSKPIRKIKIKKIIIIYTRFLYKFNELKVFLK